MPRRRPATMRTSRRRSIPAALVAAVAVVAAAAVILAGCSVGIAISLPISTGPLLTVELRGGECFAAPCGMTVILDRDGRVRGATKPPNDLGVVPPAALAALDAAISTTDFAALRSHPFTGQCPTAFDGQEIVFEFGIPAGVQRISSCEVDIDWGAPLFVAVSTALGPFVPLPTT